MQGPEGGSEGQSPPPQLGELIYFEVRLGSNQVSIVTRIGERIHVNKHGSSRWSPQIVL